MKALKDQECLPAVTSSAKEILIFFLGRFQITKSLPERSNVAAVDVLSLRALTC